MAALAVYIRRYHLIAYGRILIPIALVAIIVYLLSRAPAQSNASLPELTKALNDPEIDWSRFAYVQYVTSPEYLCNALMLFTSLRDLNTKASLVLLYPSNWSVNAIDEYSEAYDLTPVARLLQSASLDYDVTLHPVPLLKKENALQATWADSFTKLLAFNLTTYSRVLALDADAMVLQTMDELFLLPATELAMPWTNFGRDHRLSSQLMLITPSQDSFATISTAIQNAGPDEYDMDIITQLYADSVMKLPQRPYNLLTGEFRRKTHDHYLGDSDLKWDVKHVLAEAKYLHFSDWPVPKPWIRASQEILKQQMPKCTFGWRALLFKEKADCKERQAWWGFYMDFAVMRKKVCGAGFELQAPTLSQGAVFRHGRWYEVNENGDVIKGSGDD